MSVKPYTGIAYGSFKFLGHYLKENIALILAIGTGALVYVILIYFMKIPEVNQTLEVLRKKIKEKKTEKGE